MIILPEDFQNGRVTAGSPSLSPEKRAATTYRQRQAHKQEGLLRDAETKKKQAGATDGGRSRTKKDASGFWLNTSEFITRLCRLTKKLHFLPTQGFRDRISIYRITNDPEQPLIYVGAVHSDKIPEFSVFDEKTHAVKMMGWRTVLLRLVTSKIITQSAVETTFGPPRAQSKNWHNLFSW